MLAYPRKCKTGFMDNKEKTSGEQEIYTYFTGKFTTVGFFSTKNIFFVNLCTEK